MALFLVNVALFLYWKYRSTANAFVHSGPQTITPSGAAYWYFIPIAWFWKPYEAMMNLKNAYNATSADENNRLLKWWSLYWLSIIVPLFFVMTTPDPIQTMSQAQNYVWTNIVAYALDAGFLWVAADVVKSIASAEAKALGQV